MIFEFVTLNNVTRAVNLLIFVFKNDSSERINENT